MDNDEKLALLALAEGYKKTLRRLTEQVYAASDEASDDLHNRLDEINDLIDQLTGELKITGGTTADGKLCQNNDDVHQSI